MNKEHWFLPLIFLAGAGFGLAHAPYNLPYLAILALPLASYLAASTPHKLWAGYLFGLGFFLNTMSWISEPFAVGPPEYAWMAIPAWLLMALGLSFFWLPLFIFVKRGFWSVAVMFGLMEYLRGFLFTGLPWALLAYGFQDSPVAQMASVTGSYGLSFLLALGVLLLFDYKHKAHLLLGAGILGGIYAFAFLRAEPNLLDLEDYKVRVVQPNFSQEARWDPNLRRAQLDQLIALSKGEADMVVWPEGSILTSPTNDPSMLSYINNFLPAKTVIFGAPHYENGLYYNSAFDLQPDGQFYRYDKQHLVPFGEYIPFGDWLLERGIATRTVSFFNARKGKPRPYPDFEGPQPNILICYEGIFPALSRREGDFLVLITNDIWFGTRSGPYQHLAAARFRAIENGQPLVRSALTGISAVIDANGAIIKSLPLNVQDAFEVNLGKAYPETIYRRMGDWPFLILLAAGFVLIYLRKTVTKISN